MTIRGTQGRAVLMAGLAALALTLVAIVFVDRPAARWSHETFHGAEPFRALTHIVDPVLPLAALGLAVAALAASRGWRPGPSGRTVLACALAALVAVAIKDQAKFAFGRLWPETWVNGNPSWIRDGAYGFFPFHGGTGWSSFPSGHMTDITAPIAVLWREWPRWRVLLAAPVVLVAIGLFGADFHFVGDMVAGTFLGAACGVGVRAIMSAEAGAAAAAERSRRFPGEVGGAAPVASARR